MTVPTSTLPSPVTTVVAGPVSWSALTGPLDLSAIEEHQEHRV
ncbi:hypothetical protein PV437_42705 [Streptomyces scabiei]|nr:hypothetical protein [Streptomyces scabiei]MDX2539820.1 hypothetical protein [Streptomyces scabiei]